MGLDTYASRSPGDRVLTAEDEQAFEDASIELCGGMFSGDDGAFRGKVYAPVVLDVTGVSLLQEWIPPAVVSEMANALHSCDPEETARNGDVVPEELKALVRFFRLCAERGLGLVGWW